MITNNIIRLVATSSKKKGNKFNLLKSLMPYAKNK